jgi:hypothetical protein
VKRLLLDALDGLLDLALAPIIKAMRQALREELTTGELALAVEEVELPVRTVPLEPPLAVMEEQFEVWEPEHEWRARWDMMRP